MMDMLMQKIEELENPTVVGLDPTLEMMPEFIKREMLETYGKTPKAVSEMFFRFNRDIIDNIQDIVPAVKPQIAMYEKFGLEGIRAYLETIEYAKARGLIVIGDIKRGDISSTAEAYASHLGGTEIEGIDHDLWKEDFITVNPYLGYDGIEPFVRAANRKNRGMFVLVKTSNPSSGDIQDLESGSRRIYEKVAELVNTWGEACMGDNGFSRMGAVVGATYPEQGEELRRIMPRIFFLVPGYGAQGGTGKELKGFFNRDGRGCIINSSRGITAAYKSMPGFLEREFGEAAREAALAMKRDLRNV